GGDDALDSIGSEIPGIGSPLSVTRVVHPEDAIRVAEHLQAMRGLADGQVYEFDYRSLSTSGAERCVHARATVFARGEDGHVREVIGFLQDVTDARRAERGLQASEERLRLLIEGARDFAILMLDPTGCIMSWNTGAERVLGFSEEEAVGQPFAILFTPEDRDAGAPERELVEASRVGRAFDERWHVRKDGSRLWGSGVTTALRESDGTLQGFVKVLRDETARRQAQTERDELLSREKAARRNAEDAIRVRDQFVATMSHELRTPLSAILLWTKLLQNGTIGMERLKEGLEAIERSAEAQKQLINDLLDTSRIKAGKLRLDMRDTELAPLVKAAIDTIAPTAEAKRMRVEADLAKDIGNVWADPDRLQQVVWNLLTNAVKFTPSGGRVEVWLGRNGGEIELRVADTGKGIEPKFLERVFAPFSQVDTATTRLHGGLGLGMAISKEIVELHGGTIRVESPGLGQGTTFFVRLPLPEVGRAATVASIGAERAPVAEPDLAGVDVLLVEDRQETREALVSLLRDKGMQVTAVSTAAQALEAYEAKRPNVIVSDIGLPEEDGYMLIRRIRTLEVSRGSDPVPAVALSAYATENDARKSLRAGFQMHLGKPVEPDQLLWTLTQVIEQK
ncbi:MAG TPA: ATP-binding protein, partial [Polyangiaceae bacterium]|nr:ATP-binding protein [Polyangiaceae bacterium]